MYFVDICDWWRLGS